jgi:hypothetical protein
MTIKTKKFRFFYSITKVIEFLRLKKMTKTGFLVKFNFNKIIIFNFQNFMCIHEESNLNLDYYLGAV